MDLNIRPETTVDHAAIYDLTKRAFAPMPYAGGDEQDLINKLRDAGALAISLVAEQNGRVVGHIAFSPAFAADGSDGWFTLGPVSAEPELKHQGIGSAIINAGLNMLRERDAAGCVLVGNPAYYSRFGFLPFPELCPAGEPAQFYQMLPLRISQPTAVVGFHPLFHGDAA
jgi:putative acetyltransferase